MQNSLPALAGNWATKQRIVAAPGPAITVMCDENPYRWAISFHTDAGSMRASPFTLSSVVNWTGFPVTGDPFACFLKLPDWGPIVQMGWRLWNGGVAGSVEVIEILWKG